MNDSGDDWNGPNIHEVGGYLFREPFVPRPGVVERAKEVIDTDPILSALGEDLQRRGVVKLCIFGAACESIIGDEEGASEKKVIEINPGLTIVVTATRQNGEIVSDYEVSKLGLVE